MVEGGEEWLKEGRSGWSKGGVVEGGEEWLEEGRSG